MTIINDIYTDRHNNENNNVYVIQKNKHNDNKKCECTT